MNNEDTIKKLNGLFGSYRAEWLKDKIFQLFAKPCYFSGLEDSRPCVLQGGRGSGKTTALRGLSYQGQYAFHQSDISLFDRDVSYIGLYHRVDTNHVRAFVGGGVPEARWGKIFAHYFNLLICREVLCFLKWHLEKSPSDIHITAEQCQKVARSLHIIRHNNCNDSYSLLKAVDSAMYEFQSTINNIADNGSDLNLSLAGDPIKLITESICNLQQFSGKTFYILLDEYENFEDYQQVVINSLLKHNTEYYTFKIGVRELGWRKKHTLNEQELLYDPADYVLLNIEEILTTQNRFDAFAKEVCQQRIKTLLSEVDQKDAYSIEKSLPFLNYEDEAVLLGVEASEYLKELQSLKNIDDVLSLPKLYQYLIVYWSKCRNEPLLETVSAYRKNKRSWDERYGNYKYEMLFKIRHGRGSGVISKYYTGWSTFIKLSAGNIRYLMELVYRVYEQHLTDGNGLLEPIDYKTQTLVAMSIGKKNLIQLESFCKEGAKLTKLLNGMGKIFGTLAKDPAPHAAEINQFTIENSREMSHRCSELITVAVMNLALIRETGTKLGETETKDFTYSIHPIFAPFFVFSFRKKRKLVLSESDILGLIDTPKEFIKKILHSRNVLVADEDSGDDQLELWSQYE